MIFQLPSNILQMTFEFSADPFDNLLVVSKKAKGITEGVIKVLLNHYLGGKYPNLKAHCLLHFSQPIDYRIARQVAFYLNNQKKCSIHPAILEKEASKKVPDSVTRYLQTVSVVVSAIDRQINKPKKEFFEPDEIVMEDHAFKRAFYTVQKRVKKAPSDVQVQSVKDFIKDNKSIFESMESLYLIIEKVFMFPREVCLCVNLKELTISFNSFPTISRSITLLVQLESLDISYNELTYLPKEIGSLAKLTSLDISNNPLKTLPKELALLNLKKLNIVGLSLQKVPEEILNSPNPVISKQKVLGRFRPKQRPSKRQKLS